MEEKNGSLEEINERFEIVFEEQIIVVNSMDFKYSL